MAGLEHFKMHADPGMLRLEQIRKNRYKYFRWTRKTATTSLIYVVAVPFMLGVLAYKTEGKYNFRAKRKGDLIYEY